MDAFGYAGRAYVDNREREDESGDEGDDEEHEDKDKEGDYEGNGMFDGIEHDRD